MVLVNSITFVVLKIMYNLVFIYVRNSSTPLTTISNNPHSPNDTVHLNEQNKNKNKINHLKLKLSTRSIVRLACKQCSGISGIINVWFSMISCHGLNPVFFKTKNENWTSRTLATPYPLLPITFHFCLNPTDHTHPTLLKVNVICVSSLMQFN